MSKAFKVQNIDREYKESNLSSSISKDIGKADVLELCLSENQSAWLALGTSDTYTWVFQFRPVIFDLINQH